VSTFERSAQQLSCQLMTIVGEPGVGKSRLCAELFAYVDDRPELVRWRHGRCLPYGDGIAFWALGEIVKAECGILESDPPEEAEAKLDRSLRRDDPEFAWLKGRLAPLVGAGGEPASQEESFTAWRRFCESLAADGPAVLVFEDLHWADLALLSFLEHLSEWAADVPLLVLCTARPELYERQPGFGANARNVQRINLAPLTDEETAQLISMLLERAVLPAGTQQTVLARAGGNPLYAEEFVRLLSDRGELTDETDVPDSVQALIAARLDTLSPERKNLLQDAAVMGSVFWAGGLAEMGDRDPREVELALHELSRKDLVRPARTSSMEGEAEYGFWHILVRDVCYAQIARVSRAARHEAAAAWLERKAGDRVEDMADVLAHHYLQALGLTRASGYEENAGELETKALRYLALAGERALALDVERSEQSLAKALSLTHPGHPERAHLLERWAYAAQQQGRLREARTAFEEAVALYRDQGDVVSAGRTLLRLPALLATLGDPHRGEPLAEAISLLEAQPPGPELVSAYGELGGLELVFHSDYTKAAEASERALRLAQELGLPEPGRARGFRGGALAFLGDQAGLEDLRRAIVLAIEQGRSRDAGIFHTNLSEALSDYEGPEAALGVARDGVEFARRRGIAEVEHHLGAQLLTYLFDAGRPNEALDESDALVSPLEAAGAIARIQLTWVRLRILTEQGDVKQAAVDAEQLADVARETGEPQQLANGFAVAARRLVARGLPEEARALLFELESTPGIYGETSLSRNLPDLIRCALAVGEITLARRLVAGIEPLTPNHEHALCSARAQLAEAAGDHSEAAVLYAESVERWRGFGNVPERAYSLLGQGRCLAALAFPGADQPLREARELFTAMGYKPALSETDAQLGESEAAAV
jgi:tetratricopeptide (TPR) repeat protein